MAAATIHHLQRWVRDRIRMERQVVAVRMEPELVARLERLAVERGQRRSDIVRDLVAEAVEREDTATAAA